MCRAQEAYQRERAAGALLANVRAIADKAATAWGLEAIGAELREARQERTRALADTLSTQRRHARAERERGLSENPDRGFESP